MLSGLAWLLGVTALLAGMTGAWSPCGFSMVDTLGSGGGRGRGTVLASCATFAGGALVGGAATFLALSLAGAALRALGAAAPAGVAVGLAVAAAAAEARGVRIVPQVRRQVPESWRRVLPLPLAAWLYGVLLGLGFTTFVLTFAVWALAGISVALGDPALGLVVGIGFGAGRALPVVALAPMARRPAGERAMAVMAERPRILRSLRAADACALAVCAALLAAGPASAAVLAPNGTDPTAAGGDVAWQQPGASGMLRRAGRTYPLPGSDPALGGSLIAWRTRDDVAVLSRAAFAPVLRVHIPRVQKLAISDRWLVYRVRTAGGLDSLRFRALRDPGRERGIATASGATQLGRPQLSGDTAVYHVAGPAGSAIIAFDLRRRRRRTLRSSSSSQLLNPSLTGGRLLYVSQSRCGQALRLGRTGGGDRTVTTLGPLAQRDEGFEPGYSRQGSGTGRCRGGRPRESSTMFWTTALDPTYAYVSVLRIRADGTTDPTVLRVAR